MEGEMRKEKIESRMSKLFFCIFCGVFMFAVFGCFTPLTPPEDNNGSNNNDGLNGALVRIFIGENNTQARTILPGQDAVAGYQLTFTGGNRTPVNISGVNHADVFLLDGTWTITATAYKLGGEIGNSTDAVAAGSISINIAGGIITSGSVPPIILSGIGTDYGIIHYSINLQAGVTGTLTLWQIDGLSRIESFGNGGILNLSTSTNNNFNLPAGRYIAEARLIRTDALIAFRREVVVIWPNTISSFGFSPTEYLDPNAILPNSEAVLCETSSRIDNISLGQGTGSGINEEDPKIYSFRPGNPENVQFDLVFEIDSLFSTISWTINNGNLPQGIYLTGTIPFDFTDNDVLWVKAVSEDVSTVMYYRFDLLPPPPPSNGRFIDEDYRTGWISGTIHWDPALTVYNNLVTGYNIYFGSDENTPINMIAQVNLFETNTYIIESGIHLPDNAKFFLIYNRGTIDEYPESLAIPFEDMVTVTMGSFSVVSDNLSGISFVSPNLTITQSGTYYITGTGIATTNRIRVMGSNITADIIIKDINIDVGSIAGATAFDSNVNNNVGVTVNLTIEGSNYLRSGSNSAGLHLPSNGSLIIKGEGYLNATSSSYGTGPGIGINSNAIDNFFDQGDMSFDIGGALTIKDNAVVYASYIHQRLTHGVNVNNAIVFVNRIGHVYGNFTLRQDLTITSNQSLYIFTGGILNIPDSINFHNDGSIILADVCIINGFISGNQPELPDLVITGDTSYTQGRTLTITGDGSYVIGMRNDIINTEQNIVISPGVTANVTINSVEILNNNTYISPFDMSGSTVYLTLTGINKLQSLPTCPALRVPSGSTLIITEESNGYLSVDDNGYGSYITEEGARIGGGALQSGGNITINGGTISAIAAGAGIGGGLGSGNITINGANVTGSIGSFYLNTNNNGGTLYIQNNAVLNAKYIHPTLTDFVNLYNSIVFNGDNGNIHGNVTLKQDHTIYSEQVLLISSGTSLTIPEDITLQNNGNIIIAEGGIINGTVSGNQPVPPAFSVTGSESFTYTGRSLVITGDGTYVISGLNRTKIQNILVSSGVVADITLSEVNIDMINNNTAAFDMTGATVNLTILNNNYLRSGIGKAGIVVPEGSTLIITSESTGFITAIGGEGGEYGIFRGLLSGSGSGIGGNGGISIFHLGRFSNIITPGNGDNGGTIIIEGGNVTATGGTGIGGGGGPNIVGGNGGNGGSINIFGGAITAIGNSYGSGIGGGGGGGGGSSPNNGGSGGSITISGGSVNATGGTYSSGIGGGGGSSSNNGGSGGSITISDGSVNATGGTNSSGIGGGGGGSGGSINISGGTINSTNSDGGNGIGGVDVINISGGSVSATGGDYFSRGGSDISSNSSSGGLINISGGTVNATGGNSTERGGNGIINSSSGGLINISGGSVNATGGVGYWISDGSGIIGVTVEITNNSVIFASHIQATLTEGSNVNNSIVFSGNDGTLYGNVTLQKDVTFDTGRILTIPAGRSLSVPSPIILTNDGTINNSGTINGRANIVGSGFINDL